MNGHTKRPWTITGGFPEKGITIDALQSNLSEAVAWVPCDDVTDEQVREVEANARLIAAAPDLLEALTEVLDAYVSEWNEARATDDGSIKKARAAIAKATGAEQ